MPKDTDSKQITAICGLRNNHKITIKRADKGGSVVIMNTNNYITKALDHLNQPEVYQEVEVDNTHRVFRDLSFFIEQIETSMKLEEKVADQVRPHTPPRTPLFYFLPKIHKPDNPPRPIISGCDSPTDNVSKYLTSVLNPIAQA